MSEKVFWFCHTLFFNVLQTRTRCDGVANEKHLRVLLQIMEDTATAQQTTHLDVTAKHVQNMHP